MNGVTGSPHKLQILLFEGYRSPVARQLVKDVLRTLHMEITGEGEVTISTRISDVEFRKVFPDGVQPDGTLKIPVGLVPYVVSITEAPGHLSFP
jgi:hypothetical protein